MPLKPSFAMKSAAAEPRAPARFADFDSCKVWAPTMKIGIHAPDKPPVVVSLLLAILALIAYFVNTPAAFWIAMFAYIVGAVGVITEI